MRTPVGVPPIGALVEASPRCPGEPIVSYNRRACDDPEASHENRRDRSTRPRASLRLTCRKGSRHSQGWARDLHSDWAKGSRFDKMEAQDVQRLGPTLA